ncbi:MAG: Methyltransferase FkbM domain, partial [Pseudomonadota bacterium]
RITVPTFNLSDLLKHLSLNKFDYVKMDIEGAEIDALEGYS